MKIQIPLGCLIVLFIAACNGSAKDEVKNFIPGTYTRIAEHEFGKEYDTLVISEIGDQFQVQRKWKYERVLDGVVQEPEYKQETTSAVYDDQHHLLNENETGNTISFDEKEKALFVGPTKYKKLK
ncbi:MAG: hypothetical protein QM791_00220 [Ferruginibacter sp.]